MEILKRALVIVICLSLLISMASCVVIKSDLEQVQDGFMDIVEKIQSADREGIKSLFSEEAEKSQNLENSTDELVNYVKGLMMSSFPSLTNVTTNDDLTLKEYRYCYSFTTTAASYRMYVYEIVSAKGAPEREGICSLYVIRREEDVSDGDYRGDGMDTPGIHIGLVDWEATK